MCKKQGETPGKHGKYKLGKQQMRNAEIYGEMGET